MAVFEVVGTGMVYMLDERVLSNFKYLESTQ